MKSVRLIILLFALFPFVSHAATIQTPNSNGLVGYWNFDPITVNGTKVSDVSGKGFTGTTVGTVGFAKGRSGNAAVFNASGSIVSIPDISALNNAQAFTVSVWVKFNTLSQGVGQTFFAKVGNGGSYAAYDILLSKNNSNAFMFQVDNGSDGTATATYVPQVGTWVHVVGVFDGNGADNNARSKIYINGIARSMSYDYTVPSTTADQTGTSEQLGQYKGSWSLNGSLDDVRIYSRALSATEVMNLYRTRATQVQNATRPPAANSSVDLKTGLIGWWNFDGDKVNSTTVFDMSGSGNHGARQSGTSLQKGKIGQAMNFDGTINGYIDAGNGSSLNATAVTMCAWLYPVKSTTGSGFIGKRECSSGFQYGINFNPNTQVYTSGSSGVQVFGYIPPRNTWTHMCGTISSSPTELYVNGALFNSLGPGGGASTGSNTLVVGKSCTNVGTGEPFPGRLDDVRLYNRRLTSAEISTLYREGANKVENATVTAIPTTQTTSLQSGLVGYWSFDGSAMGATTALDGSGNNNTGTLVGGVKKVIGKVGQALDLDGNTGYVNAGSSSVFDVGTAVTYSMWIKPRNYVGSGGSQAPLLVKWTDGQADKHISFQTSGKVDFYLHNTFGGSVLLSNSAIPLNKWTQITAVYDGSRAYIYFNGVLDNSKAASGDVIDVSGSNMYFGFDPLRYAIESFWRPVNGTIDEVRIYNRALSAAEIQKLYRMGK